MSLTRVDENTFLFVSDVEADGTRLPVLVHWTGHDFAASTDHVLGIAKYEESHPEITEVWFVYPSDLQPTMDALTSLEEFTDRTGDLNPLTYRYFQIDAAGAWTETNAIAPDHITVSLPIFQAIREDGMRQIFRDTSAIASSGTGHHFEHPGGRHSEYFLRTAQAVARTQHAYFIAACLLPFVAGVNRSRFWADTAGILPVLGALRDLLTRLSPQAPQILIDSFGGHAGIDSLRPTTGRDYVFISSSTSGRLGQKLIDKRKASAERLITLYLLSATERTAIAGAVACDLTERGPHTIRSARTSRYRPHPTEPSATCTICAEGRGITVLDGDGFFPSPTDLRLRMPSFMDRPRTVDGSRKAGTLKQFDGSDFFEDFYGLEVVGPRSLDRPDDLTTTIAHLFTEDPSTQHVRDRLAQVLTELRKPDKPISTILALRDKDSRELARFAAAHVFDNPVEHASGVWTGSDVTFAMATVPAQTTVLVCGGVVASGRELLSMNRDLRTLPTDVETAYFMGVTHPDVTGWEILQKTLGVQSSEAQSHVRSGWKLPRELRQAGAPNAWLREQNVLDSVDSWLEPQCGMETLRDAIGERYATLSKLTPNTLFAGAINESIWPLNRRFALWTREWQEHPRTAAQGVRPTHAEVMLTVAHLMFESRRSNGSLDQIRGTTRRHGYALNPAVFDRFNDPMLQAAFLRCAEAGEFSYGHAVEPSRFVADVILYALEHVMEQGGDSSYEFLLALASPIAVPGYPGIILEPRSLSALLDGAQKFGGSNFEHFPPRVRALLLFVRENRVVQ